MTAVEIHNPSAFNPLRIYSQNRMRNTSEKTHAAPAPAPKPATRAELEKIGSEMRDVPTRVSTKFGSEMRNVPTPFYKTAGYETLGEFCTEAGEKQLRESQAAMVVAPSVQHVVDAWGKLQDRQSVPPGGKAMLQLEEHTRLAISCPGDEVMLQLSNTSNARTIRLRNLDMKSGEATHVAFIAPARDYPNAAIISANGKSAAVIELMST